MQYITIKREIKNEDGQIRFLVPALTLKNSQGDTKQKIAHPLGNDYLEFDTLEDAIKSIEISGFKYILPDGTKQVKYNKNSNSDPNTYEELVYNSLIEKTNDINSSVVAAAITALSEMAEFKLLDVFIEKMGEDNEATRTSAINAILPLGNLATEKLLQALKDENWVRRNSALIVLQRLINLKNVDVEKLFLPIVEMLKDSNTIVRTSAIVTLGLNYKLYKKQKTPHR